MFARCKSRPPRSLSRIAVYLFLTHTQHTLVSRRPWEGHFSPDVSTRRWFPGRKLGETESRDLETRPREHQVVFVDQDNEPLGG